MATVAGNPVLHTTAAGWEVPPPPSIDEVVCGPISWCHVHVQSVPAATWTIIHNLGCKNMPTLITTSAPGEPQWTDVTFVDDDTMIVEWPVPESGWAYI